MQRNPCELPETEFKLQRSALGMGKSRHTRQKRHPPGVYRRSKIDQQSGKSIYHGKWLPRMKPRREQLSSGEKLIHDHLPLGGCDTPEDAKIVRDIAAFYYGKAEGELVLANGQAFSIPPMTAEEKQSLHGMEKRQWVCRKAREVFEDFQKAQKAATSTRSGALVSCESATTVVASSPEITGSQHLTDQIFDMGCDFDARNGFPSASDLLWLQSLSWDEGDALGSTSEETTSLQVDCLQQQLCESQWQSLEVQRQLDEALMQNLELQREMECVKSQLRQCCFCLQEPYWIP